MSSSPNGFDRDRGKTPTGEVTSNPTSVLLQMPSAHSLPHGYLYPSGPRAADSHSRSVGNPPPAHLQTLPLPSTRRQPPAGSVCSSSRCPKVRLGDFRLLQPLPALARPAPAPVPAIPKERSVLRIGHRIPRHQNAVPISIGVFSLSIQVLPGWNLDVGRMLAAWPPPVNPLRSWGSPAFPRASAASTAT